MMRQGVRSGVEAVLEKVLLACAGVPLLVTAAILAVLVGGSAPLFRVVAPAEFLFGAAWAPLAEAPQYGVLPLFAGTLLVAAVALSIAVPAGLLAAIYLSEYASPRVRRAARTGLELLARVPTVVYGAAALLLLTPLLQRLLPGLPALNALSAGIVMGIMILPMVSSLSQEALQRVPYGLREAALALGATRLQATLRVVLPAARAGIAAAVVLAVARAVGETMIVTLAAGGQPGLTANPLAPVETMTTQMLQIGLGGVPAGAAAWNAVFAVGLLLFAATFGLNVAGAWLRARGREGRS